MRFKDQEEVIKHFGNDTENIVSYSDKEGNSRCYYRHPMEKLDVLAIIFPTADAETEIEKSLAEARKLYPDAECRELGISGENRVVNFYSESPVPDELARKYVDEMREKLNVKSKK